MASYLNMELYGFLGEIFFFKLTAHAYFMVMTKGIIKTASLVIIELK